MSKKILFIQYPKCTTCQKAQKWLMERGVEFEDRNIKEKNPTVKELRKWVEQSGLELKKFFNTSGLKYKKLNLKDKLASMTDDEKLELLASDGMLIKRPLVVVDHETVLVGFKENEWTEVL